jgi:hypothetical protein
VHYDPLHERHGSPCDKTNTAKTLTGSIFS